jgi:hypothetical protein
MRNQAVVIVPIYKEIMNYNELFSLNRCFDVLGNYNIVAIKPTSLNIADINFDRQFSDVVSFDDKYFKNISGYNELMLSSEFYERFLTFEYMLIYQLDAFVFSDELQYWCSRDYDYIGAPWLYPNSLGSWVNNPDVHLKSFIYRRYNILKRGLPRSKQLFNQVGNGGFSLRKIGTFHSLSRKYRSIADEYISRHEFQFNEDIFWSIELNRRSKNLSIPEFKTAAKFAIESQPDLAFQLTGNKLPFGAHAWEKHLDFWKPILETYNYRV